jgi:hypothetical protein
VPLIAAGCLLGCRPKDSALHSDVLKSDPVRITQFYATELTAPKGEPVNLCYGVENASAVRLTPPVEQLHPSLSRCFPVSQTETTTYTLFAEDKQGGTASQSITLPTTGPLPKFIDLLVNSHEVAPGGLISFCFQAKNAVAVRATPVPLTERATPARGCVIDYPRKTTTYHITITGAGGQTDEASTVVKVR